MIARPVCLTERPVYSNPCSIVRAICPDVRSLGAAKMGADALSDVFRAVRLTGAVFFNLDLHSPWVAEAPPAKDYIPYIMPSAQHLIEYHVISRGSCWGGLLDGESLKLETGDIIVFPQGDAHVMSSEPGMRFPPDMSRLGEPGSIQLPFGF